MTFSCFHPGAICIGCLRCMQACISGASACIQSQGCTKQAARLNAGGGHGLRRSDGHLTQCAVADNSAGRCRALSPARSCPADQTVPVRHSGMAVGLVSGPEPHHHISVLDKISRPTSARQSSLWWLTMPDDRHKKEWRDAESACL